MYSPTASPVWWSGEGKSKLKTLQNVLPGAFSTPLKRRLVHVSGARAGWEVRRISEARFPAILPNTTHSSKEFPASRLFP